MQYHDNTNHKYVFVCGLHRSGTSVLARNIGKLAGCTSFNNTGVLEDEGQYLQDVYPPDVTYGGVGRYGFDPRAHLTERSSLLTPNNVARLRASWHAYWDNDKSIFVEKTPANLLMTRFLQAAFPNAYFVVIRRHPVAVSMATQRWTVSLTSMHSLFDHWLCCHQLFDDDKNYLQRIYEISYEDYIVNPAKYHDEIAVFIGTHAPQVGMQQLTDSYNKRYFDRWANLVNSPFKRYYQHIAAKYEPRFAKYNYSLMVSPGGEEMVSARVSASSFGALYCSSADAVACAWRITSRTKGAIIRQLRARLPESVKNKIRRIRRKASQMRGCLTKSVDLKENANTEPWLDAVYQTVFQCREGAFIDVGANIGQTMFKILSLDSARQYIGFEPQVSCCCRIQQFLKEHHISNYAILPVGLANKNGTVKLYLRRDTYDSTVSMVKHFRPESFYTSRRYAYVRKGDEVISELQVTSVSAIKIDVEGAELEVIEGLLDTIGAKMPFIIFEVLNHFLAVTGDKLDDQYIRFRESRIERMEDILRQLDYVIFNVLPGNRLKKVSKIIPPVSADLSVTNYLAVSKLDLNSFLRFFPGSISRGDESRTAEVGSTLQGG